MSAFLQAQSRMSYIKTTWVGVGRRCATNADSWSPPQTPGIIISRDRVGTFPCKKPTCGIPEAPTTSVSTLTFRRPVAVTLVFQSQRCDLFTMSEFSSKENLHLLPCERNCANSHAPEIRQSLSVLRSSSTERMLHPEPLKDRV